MSLLHQLLQQLQPPAPSVPVLQPTISFPPSAPASMSALRQNPALRQQADQLLGAIPVLEAGGADYSGNQTAKGKSPGDLTFSAPVKVIQLWPHQFDCRLDSSNVAYKDLDLPQFVYGFLECLRHSAFSDQSKMLAHPSHLMDLASRFQWPAVRAYQWSKAELHGILIYTAFKPASCCPLRKFLHASLHQLLSAIRETPESPSVETGTSALVGSHVLPVAFTRASFARWLITKR